MIKLRLHQQEVLDVIKLQSKGQIIVPTGGGKTMCMIEDAKRQLRSTVIPTQRKLIQQVIVVVAPRILLAEQLSADFLEHITNVNVVHVHSGETHHLSTTKPEVIKNYIKGRGHTLIFTTYHSLHKIQEAEIDVNTIYFDEAHNSVQKNFVVPTEYFSMYANRCYFFTATPKHSKTPFKIGMNDEDIYGKVLVNVPAPHLVEQGVILPPKVTIKKIDVVEDSRFKHEHDCDHVVSTIDEIDTDKVLICARSTKQIVSLVSQSDFCIELRNRGYSWMFITAKTGAVVDGKKVNREQFFETLNTWGKDPEKKFVVLHRSILSEGISINRLDSVIFLRNMDVIELTQSVGRVLRTSPEKAFGLCVVPVYSKVGISTQRALQNVIDTVFEKGEILDSVTRR